MAGLVDSPSFVLVLVVSAFVPPLVFMAWIRNTARYGKEPWWTVLKAFVGGAVLSVLVAIVASVVLLVTLGQVGSVNDFFARRFTDPTIAIGALVVAPLAEEAAKGLGVRPGRPQTQALVDGLVYGAAAGLGFSATENLLYGVEALVNPNGGPSASLVVIAVRSFSSSFLHASSTAVMGYGLAKSWLTRRAWAFLPFYIVAVIMHATFNLLTSLGQLYATQYGEVGETIGFAAAVAFALLAITIVRLKLAGARRGVAR
ncbi:MAG TPA: PrsW family intramembrane metalloprotease [Thermoplasmata archaeon]